MVGTSHPCLLHRYSLYVSNSYSIGYLFLEFNFNKLEILQSMSSQGQKKKHILSLGIFHDALQVYLILVVFSFSMYRKLDQNMVPILKSNKMKMYSIRGSGVHNLTLLLLLPLPFFPLSFLFCNLAVFGHVPNCVHGIGSCYIKDIIIQRVLDEIMSNTMQLCRIFSNSIVGDQILAVKGK